MSVLAPPHKEGYLHEKTSRWPHNWKKKYLVVRDNELLIYKNMKEAMPTWKILLGTAACSYGNRDLEIKVSYTTTTAREGDDSKQQSMAESYIEFKAVTRDEQNEWVQLLQKAMVYARFHATASPIISLAGLEDDSIRASPSTDDVDNRLFQIYNATRHSASATCTQPLPSNSKSPEQKSVWRRTISNGHQDGNGRLSISQKAIRRLSKVFNVNPEDGKSSPKARGSGNELSLVEQYYREQEQMEKSREEKRKSQSYTLGEGISNFKELQEMIMHADMHGDTKFDEDSTTSSDFRTTSDNVTIQDEGGRVLTSVQLNIPPINHSQAETLFHDQLEAETLNTSPKRQKMPTLTDDGEFAKGNRKSSVFERLVMMRKK